MGNYRIELDQENGVLLMRYFNTAYYRTLLKSFAELLTLPMPDRVRIVLDFSEVKSFLIDYGQIINYRLILLSLLPRGKVTRIAIINAPNACWGDIPCSFTPLMENSLFQVDMRGFGAQQRSEAYQWI